MKGILQEKFQLAAKGKIENGGSWVSLESQRKTYRPETFNAMPPGMSVDPAAETSMPLSLAGSPSKKGFQHQNMSPVDDMYSNEHIDLFYGESKVDGVTGFIERNNYLDRA